MRPELLAVRAINQYRSRDVLAYLALRYYLDNRCSRSDLWGKEVSTHLLSTRTAPAYFRTFHFKEADGDSVVHRSIFIPGPNEALAETALLYECSKYPSFRSSDNVYSYHFPNPQSKEGVFRAYFPGYRGRHISIAQAVRSLSDSKVQYTDIKKFYPSISKELALKEWKLACDSSDISNVYRDLGQHLLTEYSSTATAYNEGTGVLIGPMFSHLIANLILAKVDKTMSENMGGNYWRYVDDIVLVGSADQVKKGRELLSSILDGMGFLLHEEGKDYQVDSNTWLEGAQDFDGAEGKVWTNLIVNIKQFLIAQPDGRSALVSAFSESGINIPLLDYSNAVLESSYLEKVSDWLVKKPWVLKSRRELSIQELVDLALRARRFYSERINTVLGKNPETDGYARKRLIPKLRFYAGRLFFLATPDVLSSVSFALVDYPELLLQSNVLNTIQSRNVSSLLKLGTNAVQAAAQILRIQKSPVICSLTSFTEVELQGLAILRLNSIEINFTEDVFRKTISDLLNQFALGNNQLELMRSGDPFIKEIACLRGIDESPRHKLLLDTAFDRDEKLIFDVISQLHQSSYF